MAGRRIQYQQIARPVTIVTVAAIVFAVSSPGANVIFPRSFIYQAKTDPVLPSAPPVVTAVVPSVVSSPVIFPQSFIYQSKAECPRPVAVPTVATESVSSEVIFQQRTIYQTKAEPIVPPAVPAETITADKWLYPWAQPGIIKQLPRALAPPLAFAPLNPDTEITQSFESKWHYPWSEPVRTRNLATAQQQSIAVTTVFPEVITESKWHYPWSEPVRTRQLATAHQQQPAAGIPFNPGVSLVYHPWSEPVRTRQLTTAAQQQPVVPPRVVAPAFDPSKSLIENVEGAVWFYRAIIGSYLADPRVGPAAPPFNPATSYVQMVLGDTGVTFQTSLVYQVSAEAEVFSPGISWFFPFAEPVRQLQGLTAQQQQFIAFYPLPISTIPPVTAVTPSVVSAEVIFPTSFIYQAHIEPALPQPTPPPTIIVPSAVSSQVVFPKSFIYQAHAEPVQKPAVVTAPLLPITAWSEPVRTRQLSVAHQQQPILVFVFDASKSLVYQPLSDPVRTKQLAVACQQQPALPPTVPAVVSVTITAEGFFGGALYRQTVIYQSVAEPIVPAAAVVIPPHEWFAPLTVRPTDVSRRDHTTFVLEPETQITPTYESRWHYAWSEPVRTRKLAPAYQQSLAFVLNPDTQITQKYEAKWAFAWSEPTRRRAAAFAQAYIDPTYGWKPVAPPPAIQLVLGDTGVVFQTWFAYQVSVDVQGLEIHNWWLQPFSEPVRQKPGLAVHLQQQPTLWPLPILPPPPTAVTPSTVSTEVIFPRSFIYQARADSFVVKETITADKWIYAWSDPVRTKRFAVAYQPSFTLVLEPNTEITPRFESRWHYPWSEPVRTRQLAVAQQQALIPPLLPIVPPEVIGEDKWAYAWSEPVRRIQRGIAQQQQPVLVLNPETQIIQGYESRWHQPWSEPVRVRQLATAQYQALIPRFAPIGPPAPVVTEGYFSGPIYRLTVTYQSAAEPILPVISLPQIIPDKFFPAWPDPVRTRQLATAQQQQPALVLNPDLITGKYESRWHYAWSEPVRKKPGLSANLQPFTSLPVPPFPTFLRVIPWLSAYAEPVRKKPGLGAWLQGYYVKPPQKPAGAIDITVTLYATEINNDTALMLVNVSGAPVYCSVAVKELKLTYTGAVSIEELPVQRQSAVSIVSS